MTFILPETHLSKPAIMVSVSAYLKELTTLYTTTRLVNIRSPVIAIIHLILTLLIWCSFFGGINFDVRKLYQVPCPVTGIVLSKVKGFASTESLSDEELAIDNANLYKRIWDPQDLLYPSHGGEGETGSFLIVTNLIITPNQTRGTCAETPDSSFYSKCREDVDCPKGYWTSSTHGIFTGRCVNTSGTCEIGGWCPIKKDKLPRKGLKPLLEDIKNFTLLLRNTVEFPNCGNRRGRLISSQISKEYLQNCTYNEDTDPTCPIFKIGDIVRWSGDHFNKVAIRGGVFRIKVQWDCDFDFGRTLKDCRPKFQFLRVDDKRSKHYKGWNFRSAVYYSENRRTLVKNFAIKILIDLEGEGRQFNFFQFVTTLGATIGLVSVAPLMCDLLLDLFNWIGGWVTLGTGKECALLHHVTSRYVQNDKCIPDKSSEANEEDQISRAIRTPPRNKVGDSSILLFEDIRGPIFDLESSSINDSSE